MYRLSEPESFVIKGQRGTIAQHLGYSVGDKLLIINADDFGLGESVNIAVGKLFDLKKISSTTIMVTAASYGGALGLYHKSRFACGIHLSLTSDHIEDGSKPISDPRLIPSLLASGRLHPDRDHFFRYATPREAYLEARSQVEKALEDGIDLTHLDSHEGTLQLRPDFADTYLRLALEYKLPVRAGSRAFLEQVGMRGEWIDKMRAVGVFAPDNLVYFPIDFFESYEQKEEATIEVLNKLPAGITEMYFHPTDPDRSSSVEAPESHRQVREWDYRCLLSERVGRAIADNKITTIDFRVLRDLMRAS